MYTYMHVYVDIHVHRMSDFTLAWRRSRTNSTAQAQLLIPAQVRRLVRFEPGAFPPPPGGAGAAAAIMQQWLPAGPAMQPARSAAA